MRSLSYVRLCSFTWAPVFNILRPPLMESPCWHTSQCLSKHLSDFCAGRCSEMSICLLIIPSNYTELDSCCIWHRNLHPNNDGIWIIYKESPFILCLVFVVYKCTPRLLFQNRRHCNVWMCSCHWLHVNTCNMDAHFAAAFRFAIKKATI